MINQTKKPLLRCCPICSNDEGEVLHTQSFSLPNEHPLPESYDVVVCSKCGFAFADSSGHQKDYDLFYKDFSKYEYSKMEGEGLINDNKKLERTADDISSFIEDKSANILDVGCAEGDLLLKLKNRGYNNLNGLDPSSSCISYINNEHKIDAHVGGLFENLTSVFNKKEFDFVILTHVFEHIYDLSTAIQNIYSVLKDDGILYLEVPDASRYLEYYIVPFYYFDIEHINHFDEHSLTNLTSMNGFERISIEKKEFNVSEQNLYPAVYGLFRKVDKKNSLKICPNFGCKKQIKEYIKKSQKSNVFPEIDSLVDSNEEIVVWGAGSYTTRLLENTQLDKCNIIAFVDSDFNKHGSKIKNIKIYPPSIIKKCSKLIVISSAIYSNDITKQIKKMGLKNDIIIIKGL
jgi:ubiquinone/menaquinone biosynthesis C-methylase UbiE